MSSIKLDPIPTNVSITQQDGLPTNSFVIFLTKLVRRISGGMNTTITIMDSPTTYKTLHFTDGLLTSIS